MIVCPHCNHRNRERAERCEACGGSLAHFAYRSCPSCDALNPAGNVYCHRCFSLLDEELRDSLEGAESPVEPFAPPQRPARPEPRPAPKPGREHEEPPQAEAREDEELYRRLLQRPHPPEESYRRPAPPSEAAESLEVTEENDPLAGIEDAIELEPTVRRPHRLVTSSLAEPSDAEMGDAELFRQVATTGGPLAEGVRVVVPWQPQVLSRGGRGVLYALVLLAALIPYLSRGVTTTLIRPRPAVAALAAGIEGLEAGRPVLISFDYGPAYSAEMNSLALALARQLARNSVPMLVMSTTPTGLGLAEAVLLGGEERPLASGLPTLALSYGEDVVILGYAAGQEAGLRSLLAGVRVAFSRDAILERELSDLTATAEVYTLQDVAHIFVLTDDAASMRRWVEQVGVHSGARLHALVASRVEPILLPYRESGQIVTLVGGVTGAAEYEQASNLEGPARRYSDGVAALVLLVLLVAAAANIVEWRQRVRNREGSRS